MRKDRLTSPLLGAFAAAYCAGALRLGLGTLHNPGPGLIPFVSGALLLVLSAGIFVRSLVAAEGTTPVGAGWSRAAWVVGSLFLYLFALDRLGFLATTFLFLLLCLLSFQPRRVGQALLVSTATVAVSYVVFSLWLKVQFPRGFLGV